MWRTVGFSEMLLISLDKSERKMEKGVMKWRAYATTTLVVQGCVKTPPPIERRGRKVILLWHKRRVDLSRACQWWTGRWKEEKFFLRQKSLQIIWILSFQNMITSCSFHVAFLATLQNFWIFSHECLVTWLLYCFLWGVPSDFKGQKPVGVISRTTR